MPLHIRYGLDRNPKKNEKAIKQLTYADHRSVRSKEYLLRMLNNTELTQAEIDAKLQSTAQKRNHCYHFYKTNKEAFQEIDQTDFNAEQAIKTVQITDLYGLGKKQKVEDNWKVIEWPQIEELNKNV